MEESGIHFERIMSYLNDYCAESLTELTVSNGPKGLLVRFVKTMPSIHSL